MAATPIAAIFWPIADFASSWAEVGVPVMAHTNPAAATRSCQCDGSVENLGIGQKRSLIYFCQAARAAILASEQRQRVIPPLRIMVATLIPSRVADLEEDREKDDFFWKLSALERDHRRSSEMHRFLGTDDQSAQMVKNQSCDKTPDA
jgi:hypothetical protein